MFDSPDSPASERAVIERLRGRFSATSPRLVLGIGDDTAVLRLDSRPGAARVLNATDQLVTTDMMVEGVHFRLDWTGLADVGFKALAVNLSDIAAMGGTPSFAFGSLAVPPGATLGQIDELLDGVEDAARGGGCQLVGGDTVRGRQWVVSFTVLGDVQGAALTRDGARPGDSVWHSGAQGLSQLGLMYLSASEPDSAPSVALAAHHRPRPQLELGGWLQRHGYATACQDTSDSLAQCLVQLADASQCGLMLDFASYPFHPAVRGFAGQQRGWRQGGPAAFSIPARFNPGKGALRFHTLTEFVLHGSEDFQLLFTTPPSADLKLLRSSPVGVVKIGTVVPAQEGRHYRAEDRRSYPLTALGWEH